MRRIWTTMALLLPFLGVGGCTWQANSGSEAVKFDPFALGSGESIFSPANGPGYINGDPQDMRSKH